MLHRSSVVLTTILPFSEWIESKWAAFEVEFFYDATSISKVAESTKRSPTAPIVERYHESIQWDTDTVHLLHWRSTREESRHEGESFENAPKMASYKAEPFFSRREKKEKWENRVSWRSSLLFHTRIISLFKTQDEHPRRMSIIQCLVAVSSVWLR